MHTYTQLTYIVSDWRVAAVLALAACIGQVSSKRTVSAGRCYCAVRLLFFDRKRKSKQ
jgi:hypothetical protein